jgi:uncharacterized protein (TIGR00369 family)
MDRWEVGEARMNALHEKTLDWANGNGELAPVTRLLGIEPLEIGPGLARLQMDAREEHHNAMGAVHGGILCDLADVAIGVALASTLAEEEVFTTVDLHMSYFRAIREARISAVARVVRRGRSTAYVECEIIDGEGKLAAKAASTCMVFRSSDP